MAVPGTAADRGREVRLRLLGTAAALIAELGWSAVSTRVLAERAAVTPGLVHYHFPSLQALLRDAALGMISDLLSRAEGVLENSPALDAGVELVLGSFDVEVGDRPMSALLCETYLAATRDEALRVELDSLAVEFRRHLCRWLADHGASAPEASSSVLIAVIDGMLLRRALDPDLTAASLAPLLRGLVDRGTGSCDPSR